MSWVKTKAECRPEKFLRKLRKEIEDDICDANTCFEKEKSFLIRENSEKDIRVERYSETHPGQKDSTADSFVRFFLLNNKIIVEQHYYQRNGELEQDSRSGYGKKPLGEILIEWDREKDKCIYRYGDAVVTTIEIRRKTLDDLFFG